MDIEKIERTVKSIALPVINNLGYELADVEFVNEEDEWYLRIYIDNDNGNEITIDDCTRVSRAIDELIDEADPVDIGYYLEVSSPGLDRKLKSDKDLEKYSGKNIKIFLNEAADGKFEIEGKLEGFSEEKIIINNENIIKDIDRKVIKQIRLNDFD